MESTKQSIRVSNDGDRLKFESEIKLPEVTEADDPLVKQTTLKKKPS